MDNVLSLSRINMKARCHEGKKLLVVKCIVISNNNLFCYCIVHDGQNSVGLVEDSSTSCMMVAKVRKIVATTKQKRTKAKINQNMTDAPPFWHTFCEDMVNRMNRTIIKQLNKHINIMAQKVISE